MRELSLRLELDEIQKLVFELVKKSNKSARDYVVLARLNTAAILLWREINEGE